MKTFKKYFNRRRIETGAAMKNSILLFNSLVFVCLALVAKGEPANDFSRLLENAQAGDASAQYNLGVRYATGEGVLEDDKKAVKWFHKAAEQGCVEAQSGLGNMYYFGLGVPEDYSEAVKWYRLAAEQGDADAQVGLGRCYARGNSVPEDDVKAVKWYRLAAEQGNADAQYRLGYCYSERDGIFFDKKEAVRWLKLAQNQGHGLASLAVWTVDDEVAIELYRIDAEKGDPRSQYSLGEMYKNGEGVVENYREAAKWFRLAAEQGYGPAQHSLGVMYENGEGVLESYVEAYAWYLLNAMNGHSLAQSYKAKFAKQLSSSQIASGQQRARELQALIERKNTIAKSDSDQPLSSEITPSGFGSGLLVKGGYILTCWHVVEDAERISISYNGQDHVANIIQKDPANDIAILKVIDINDGAVLNFSKGVKLGEKIFTLGYPLPSLQGSDVKFTTGSISSLTGIENSPRYFQISAPLQAGNSGGPLFDEHGNLVGIVAAKLDSMATLALTGDLPQNVNYAIKADYLVPLLKTVEELEVGKEKTKDVNLLELIEELKKSAVMIKVY